MQELSKDPTSYTSFQQDHPPHVPIYHSIIYSLSDVWLDYMSGDVKPAVAKSSFNFL